MDVTALSVAEFGENGEASQYEQVNTNSRGCTRLDIDDDVDVDEERSASMGHSS